jgi:hypothetical protein
MAFSRVDRPIDLLRFVSLEHEQFLVSIANDREEFLMLSHLQGLYEAVLSDLQVAAVVPLVGGGLGLGPRGIPAPGCSV